MMKLFFVRFFLAAEEHITKVYSRLPLNGHWFSPLNAFQRQITQLVIGQENQHGHHHLNSAIFKTVNNSLCKKRDKTYNDHFVM